MTTKIQLKQLDVFVYILKKKFKILLYSQKTTKPFMAISKISKNSELKPNINPMLNHQSNVKSSIQCFKPLFQYFKPSFQC